MKFFPCGILSPNSGSDAKIIRHWWNKMAFQYKECELCRYEVNDNGTYFSKMASCQCFLCKKDICKNCVLSYERVGAVSPAFTQFHIY